jgi:hypothetical protein
MFGKKYRVLVNDYSDKIIAEMIQRSHSVYSRSFWQFIEHEYRGKQDFSWRKQKNYIVFAEEKDYTIFLLKVM